MMVVLMLPLPRYKKNIVKAQEEANVYAARAACKAAAANQHQAGLPSLCFYFRVIMTFNEVFNLTFELQVLLQARRLRGMEVILVVTSSRTSCEKSYL